MTDIFREVEEEVRRERFEQLWKKYGDYLVAAVALVIIAVAGYQLWTRYENNQRLKASENLIAAQQLADAGDANRANQELAVVARDAPQGYADMAKLTEAGVLLGQGKHDEAVQIYRSIAADDHGPIGDVALIRAGWATADTSSRQDLGKLLGPLTDPGSPWHSAATEILAYADYRTGQIDAARSEFDAITKDKNAPDAMRRRAQVMADFLKSGGLQNYGTVPKPVPEPPTPAQSAPTGSKK